MTPDARIASCDGKARFSTYTRAAHVARRQSRRHAERMQVYTCRHCGGFHIGESKSRKGRRP